MPRHRKRFILLGLASLGLVGGSLFGQSTPTDPGMAAPSGGPPDMIPPPPPNITPPTLPPNMTPPSFTPTQDPMTEDALQGPRGEDMAMLERFLRMPPENLAKIRKTLERLENMSEEERKLLLQRIGEFKQMNENRRRGMMRQLEGLSREERRNVLHYFFQLSPENRRLEQEKITSLSQDEKTAYLKQLALENPAPPLREGEGRRRGGPGRPQRGSDGDTDNPEAATPPPGE